MSRATLWLVTAPAAVVSPIQPHVDRGLLNRLHTAWQQTIEFALGQHLRGVSLPKSHAMLQQQYLLIHPQVGQRLAELPAAIRRVSLSSDARCLEPLLTASVAVVYKPPVCENRDLLNRLNTGARLTANRRESALAHQWRGASLSRNARSLEPLFLTAPAAVVFSATHVCEQRLAEPPAHHLPDKQTVENSHWHTTGGESVYREKHDELSHSLTTPGQQ